MRWREEPPAEPSISSVLNLRDLQEYVSNCVIYDKKDTPRSCSRSPPDLFVCASAPSRPIYAALLTMTTVRVHGGIDILRLPVNQEEHNFPPWHIKYTQSHILHSKCSKHEEGCCEDSEPCQFCVYNKALEMPHMPDMVFPNNILYLKHSNGASIEFNALDALKRVSNGKIHLQLACAEAWKESRLENKEYLEEKLKPFDWTFTSDYMGTIANFQVQETTDRIDVDKLKVKEKILFYHDLTLYEDELHDHGIAATSVKIRVMPNSLFILLRYFLRVDNVMIRVNDTRIYHEFDQDFLLREFTSREAKVKDLRVPPTMFIDPSRIAPHLPLKDSRYEKLIIPSAPVDASEKIEKMDTEMTENAEATSETSKEHSSTEDIVTRESTTNNSVT